MRRDDHVPLYLLLIDANKFKSINDTYVHIQGDAALERIADSLRISCGAMHYRANIARYGGDEFVILARTDQEREVEELKKHTNENLESLNKSAGAPYPLSVSIGIARANRHDSLKRLIEQADAKLYEEKQMR